MRSFAIFVTGFALVGIADAADLQRGVPPPDPILIAPVVRWASVECNVLSYEQCEDWVVADAPAGFQACKPMYSEVERMGDAGYRFDKRRLEANNVFRGYRYGYYAYGNAGNGTGSKIRLENVGLFVVPNGVTADKRRQIGCEVP